MSIQCLRPRRQPVPGAGRRPASWHWIVSALIYWCVVAIADAGPAAPEWPADTLSRLFSEASSLRRPQRAGADGTGGLFDTFGHHLGMLDIIRCGVDDAGNQNGAVGQ